MNKLIKTKAFVLTLLLALSSCGTPSTENPTTNSPTEPSNTEPTTNTTGSNTTTSIETPTTVDPTSEDNPSTTDNTTSVDIPTTTTDNPTSADIPTTTTEDPTSSPVTSQPTTHIHTFGDEYEYDETHHWYPSTCGHEEAEERIKHTFKSEVTEPTYESEGFTTYTCTECGYSYIDNRTDPLEHNYSKTLSYDEHTHWYACTDKGYEHLKKDEKPHEFDKKVTDPTFESEGYTTYSCKHCDYSYIDDETDPLEHNYSTTLTYDEHTHRYACVDDGYEHLKKDEKPHEFTKKVTDPTYESKGYTTYSCKYCDYSYIDNETDPLEHNYSTTLTYDEHTHWYACIDDGYEHLKKDEEDHDFEATVTPSTYLEKGYTTYKCKVCGYSYVDDYTELLKHTITYNLNGGVNSPLNPSTFTVEDEFILQPATKEGLAFQGWFDENDEQVFEVLKGTNEDLELTAKWADVFTIEGNTLVKVDGSIPLYQIDIPSNITTIGENAFSECEYLGTVSIPESVIKMETGAFDGCSELSYVIYKGTLDQWSQITFDYVTATPMYSASSFYIMNSFGQYEEVTSIELSSEITEIKSYAFSGFSSITLATISKNTAKLNYFSFKGCTSLEEVKVENGSVLKTIGESAFYGCSSLESVELPNGLETIEESAFEECKNLSSITLPESLNTLERAAFQNNQSLKSINIPSNITTIKEHVFGGCTSLVDIDISNSVKTIEGFAFTGCCSLTSLEFPNSVTTIGEYAFANCDEIRYIIMPNSVSTIGLNAFDECRASIYCEASSKPSGWNLNWAPSYCTLYWDVTSNDIYVKDGVHYLLYNSTCYVSAFLDTYEDVVLLETVNFKGTNYSVTVIGGSAFANSYSLKSIKLPSTLQVIKDSAFSGVDLDYIVIPNSVYSIEYNAFYLCFYLTIYCEAGSKQSGWDSDWNSWDCPVYYNGEWEYDSNGVPTPINFES